MANDNAMTTEAGKESQALVKRYESFTVTCQAEYDQGAEELKAIKAQKKKWTELRLSITRPLDESKRVTMDLFKSILGCSEMAEKFISDQLDAYEAKQEAIRRAEEARLRAEQEKQTARLNKLAAAAQERAEKAAEDGNEAKAAQDKAKAEEFDERAADVDAAPVVVASRVNKVEGMHRRENWKAEVTDAMLVPREWLIPDLKEIGEHARSRKARASIPGVRFYCETTRVTRADTNKP